MSQSHLTSEIEGLQTDVTSLKTAVKMVSTYLQVLASRTERIVNNVNVSKARTAEVEMRLADAKNKSKKDDREWSNTVNTHVVEKEGLETKKLGFEIRNGELELKVSHLEQKNRELMEQLKKARCN